MGKNKKNIRPCFCLKHTKAGPRSSGTSFLVNNSHDITLYPRRFRIGVYSSSPGDVHPR